VRRIPAKDARRRNQNQDKCSGSFRLQVFSSNPSAQAPRADQAAQAAIRNQQKEGPSYLAMLS
jgi:hypothetical protein